MRKVIFFAAVSLIWMSCQPSRHYQLDDYTTEYITVDSITAEATRDKAYEEYLAPTKAFMDAEMGIVLGYAANEMWIDSIECPMLNWTADVLLEKAREVCPFPVDMALQNTGGARTSWTGQKPITLEDVFSTMPFNNRMVVLRLKGADVIDLFRTSFAAVEHAHGVAGVRVKIDHRKLEDLKVGGKNVDPEADYTIATSNYLSKGKDGMVALTRYDSLWDSGLLIRDIYIEAVRKQDTVRAAVDGRVTIKK